MAIENILIAIKNQAIIEKQDIIREADEKARQIIQDAEDAANREVERFVAEASAREERNAVRDLHTAQIARGRMISDVRTKNYDRLREMTQCRLEELRDCPEYEEIFNRLVRDVIFGLGDKVCLYVDERDQDLAAKVAKSPDFSELDIQIVPTLTTLGGVIATSQDERIRKDNTFESRITRFYSERAKDIWEVLET